MDAVFANSDVLVPTAVTLVVALLQSAVEELGAWVVVVAVETDAGSFDAVVEEVASFVEMIGSVLCVVTSTDDSGLETVVVLTNGRTVAESDVFVALTVD